MFIEQAYKGNNAVWRVLFVSLFTSGIFIAGLIQFFFFDMDVEAQMAQLQELIPNKNLLLAANLVPFAFLLGLLFLLVWAVHERGIMTLTTVRERFDFKRFLFAISIVFIYTVGSFAISYYIAPDSVVLQFDPVQFCILVIISLILFPFQIGLEEWLFRGYLMQQIGVAAGNKWMPLIITSVFFGVAHWANPEVAEMGAITMVYYIGTGLFLGIITLMDDGLELALGFHLANNFLAATLITADYSALQTDAIFKSIAPAATGAEIVLPVVIIFPIMIFIFAKKYKWTNWKERLTGKVVPPVIEVKVID